MNATPLKRSEPKVLLVAVTLILVVSRIGAYDPLTWFLVVRPVLLIAPVLVATYRSPPLTGLV